MGIGFESFHFTKLGLPLAFNWRVCALMVRALNDSLWLENLTFFSLCHNQCIITVGNLQNTDAFFYMLFPNVLDQLLRAMPSNRLEDLFLDHKSPNILSFFVLIKNGKIKASDCGWSLMFSLLSMGCGSHCVPIRRPWHSR